MSQQPFNSDSGFSTTGNITSGNIITTGSGGDITMSGGNIAGVRNITSSGNFDIDGNIDVGGNLFVSGNINFSGNVTQITGNSGVFYGNASTGVGALYAGKTGYTPVPNTIVQMTGDENAYIQINLQNTNHGNTASMEIAITADDGTDTTNYIDMGIASSTWDGTQDNSLGTAVATRDGYLYVQGGSTGGNLVLGTTTAGYAVKFNAGGPGSANTVAQISNTGITTTGIVSATGNVRGANINTAGVVSAVGNISGNYFIGNGSQLTGIAGSYGNSDVATFLAAFGSNTVSTTGNITSGNIRPTANIAFTSNAGQINFNTTAYITGNAVGREGSISLQPYTGAGSTFPGVLIGGAGRILAPNGSAHLVLNTSDFTVQVAQKIISGTAATSTATGALQVSGNGGIGVTGNVYAGNVYSVGLASVTGNTTTGNLLTAGLVSATGNITTAGNFVGNGAALTNVTVSVAGNIIGTQSNVTLVAGSYSYTFDNTGILTLPAPPTGNEGGEIDFTQAANSTLAGNTVVVDQYVDRIRFFESGGNTRGAYIDLSQAADGVGTLLNNRVSGIVNSGVFVTMDLLKVQLTSSGNRGLSIASTTGTFTVNIGATYSTASSTTAGSAAVVVVTTTPSTSLFSWNFTGQADTSTYVLTDITNNRAYRVILQIGASFNNNLITIERLV